MQRIPRLLAAAVLALLVPLSSTASAHGTAQAMGPAGTLRFKDAAGDWNLRMPRNLDGAAASDLRSVTIEWKRTGTLVLTFRLSAFPAERVGTGNYGEASVNQRRLSVQMNWRDDDFIGTQHIRFIEYLEGAATSRLATYPAVSVGDSRSQDALKTCRKGSVRVDEAAATVTMKVPASCHRIPARPGTRYTASALASITAVVGSNRDTFGIDSTTLKTLVLR